MLCLPWVSKDPLHTFSLVWSSDSPLVWHLLTDVSASIGWRSNHRPSVPHAVSTKTTKVTDAFVRGYENGWVSENITPDLITEIRSQLVVFQVGRNKNQSTSFKLTWVKVTVYNMFFKFLSFAKRLVWTLKVTFPHYLVFIWNTLCLHGFTNSGQENGHILQPSQHSKFRGK